MVQDPVATCNDGVDFGPFGFLCLPRAYPTFSMVTNLLT